MPKFIIEPHFRLQEWVAEEKDYFRKEGLDYEFRELMRATDGKIHDKGNKVGAFQSFEEGPQIERELRLPLDGQRRRLQRPRQDVHRRLFGGAGGHFRAGQFEDEDAGRSRRRADFGRLSSPAATTPPCRRSSSISSPNRSTSSMPTACCSSAWNC